MSDLVQGTPINANVQKPAFGILPTAPRANGPSMHLPFDRAASNDQGPVNPGKTGSAIGESEGQGDSRDDVRQCVTSTSDADTAHDGQSSLVKRLLFAFHYACDLRDQEIARRLLMIAEAKITADRLLTGPTTQRGLDRLIAAHERLWLISHET